MTESNPYRVLFLCTGNSARSVLAEAILNRAGADRFIAMSAGSKPTGTINPCSIDLLTEHGYDTTGLRSKSWDELADLAFDLVVTVCDNAAQESCPVWLGQTMKVHWGLPDPATAEEQDKPAAFRDCYDTLLARITQWVSWPLATMDHAQLKSALTRLGQVSQLPQSTDVTQ